MDTHGHPTDLMVYPEKMKTRTFREQKSFGMLKRRRGIWGSINFYAQLKV